MAQSNQLGLSNGLLTIQDVLNQSGKELSQHFSELDAQQALADKFKLMEIDRQIEKEEESSQDNIFPESKANLFTQFGQAADLAQFHEKTTWEEKYKIALGIKDPRANFMLKRLIFDESPQTLSSEDFKKVHRELHDRLVINQDRPLSLIHI